MKGLEKFDDTRRYGNSNEGQKRLTRIEIKRLIKVVEDTEPFLFDSHGVLTSTTEEGLAELSNLADQINSNFAILKNDNARHVLQYCPSRLYRAVSVSAFTRSRRTLYARYKQDLDKVLGSRPKTLEPPNRNKEAYFALVDYVTGTAARLVTRSAYSAGGYWENHALAILAQWAMKLKVLPYNPAYYAAIALDDGDVMVPTIVEESRVKKELEILVPVAETANEFTSVNALDQETDITTHYYEENFLNRDYMENILQNALAALYASESSGNNASYFELSTLVYQTGIEKTLTVLANDRDGDYSASSDPAHVKCTFTAFEQLLSNAFALQAKRGRGIQRMKYWSAGSGMRAIIVDDTRPVNSARPPQTSWSVCLSL